ADLTTSVPNESHNKQPEGRNSHAQHWLASIARYGRFFAGTGISTRCPSATPVGLALGSDSPRAERPSPGTLGHSAEEVLTPLSLLMPAFSLERAPRLVCTTASMPARRSPTHCETQCRGFGSALEPRYIVGAKPLDQ